MQELSANFSTPYFANLIPNWAGGHSDVMGCRTRLNTTWTGDWDLDTLRTGNLAYISLNLPRMEYKEGEFYDNLDDVMSKAEQLLLIRREHSIKCMDQFNLLSFLNQKGDGENTYYRIENATLSFGLVGMHETLLAMGIENGIISLEGQRVANEILVYINEYIKDLSDETGYRWTVLQTPAESTAHRFATLDKRRYKDKAITNGAKDSLYYTNSTHVPVDSELNVIQRAIIEEQFHPLTAGGHIFHAFTGEAHPDVTALTRLTEKIAKQTNVGFWAYSSAFSYCFRCNHHMRGLQEKCFNCGTQDDVEWYDRITGYIQAVGRKKDAVGGWNSGKKQELMDRKRNSI